jgi:hypothetical protein
MEEETTSQVTEVPEFAARRGSITLAIENHTDEVSTHLCLAQSGNYFGACLSWKLLRLPVLIPYL